jgi:hypothetical protein
MKINTSELTGAALNWAVEKIEFMRHSLESDFCGGVAYARGYSIDWGQGGPIIERERMDIECWDFHSMPWKASMWWDDESSSGDIQMYGTTPLIAAMRCYVASKLGDEIEIPEELTK